MSTSIRVLIVNDDRLLSECLAFVLATDPRFTIVGVADCLDSALRKVRRHRPDILLLDLSLQRQVALELTRQPAVQAGRIKVLVLGLPEDEAAILECIEAGAAGFLLKEDSLDVLKRTIESAVQGEVHCSPQIARSAFARLAQLAREQHDLEALGATALSPRKLEILRLISEGLSNKQIAKKLDLSLFTVKNHIHAILDELQVEDRREAVQYAYAKRWINRQWA